MWSKVTVRTYNRSHLPPSLSTSLSPSPPPSLPLHLPPCPLPSAGFSCFSISRYLVTALLHLQLVFSTVLYKERWSIDAVELKPSYVYIWTPDSLKPILWALSKIKCGQPSFPVSLWKQRAQPWYKCCRAQILSPDQRRIQSLLESFELIPVTYKLLHVCTLCFDDGWYNSSHMHAYGTHKDSPRLSADFKYLQPPCQSTCQESNLTRYWWTQSQIKPFRRPQRIALPCKEPWTASHRRSLAAYRNRHSSNIGTLYDVAEWFTYPISK